MRQAELVILIALSVLTCYGCKRQAPKVKSSKQYKIAFTSDRDGNEEIYVMNADGSAQRNLTNDPFSDTAACWSPDGKKIAFVANRKVGAGIYVMNADGSGLKNLTNDSAFDTFGGWSFDGEKIACGSWRPSIRIPLLSFFSKGRAKYYIGIVNLDGTEKKQLTHTGRDWRPVWSPVPLPTKEP